MKYRGIEIDDSIKLINSDGSHSKRIRESIDKLADTLEARGHRLLSSYKGTNEYVLIDFKCGKHESASITAKAYKKSGECPKCSGRSSEQAKEDFFAKLKENGNELLNEYIDNTTKVLIDFKCGRHESASITPKAYKKSGECPKCSGRSSEQAKEDFFAKLKENGHELLNEYINNTTKVLIDFKCTHEPSKKSPKGYKKRQVCSKCSGASPIQAREDFFQMLEDNGHELLGDYIDNTTKVMIYFKCKHEPYARTPKEYKNERMCPRCGNNSDPKVAKEDFFAILKSKGHRLQSKYIDNTTDVLIDFKCIHKPSTITPKLYKRGNGSCKKCNLSKGGQKQNEDSKKSLIEKVKRNKHKLFSKYIDTSTKVLIDFNCGHNPSWVSPHHYKNGRACQQCNKKYSRGEVVIKNYLKRSKLIFKQQYTFKDLTYKGKLRFDFALFKDNELHMLIEFDGRQHFEPVNGWGGKEGFRIIQLKDKMKNDYCLENNIKLFRIKYTEYNNIESILEKELLSKLEHSRDVISFYPKLDYYESNFEEQLGVVLD